MKIHHFDFGTMCPWARPLVNGGGSWLSAGEMVCHCLLIETDDGLVLVDTGLGTADIAHPRERLGTFFNVVTRPKLQREQTALAHVERLGFRAKDVRHILPTHLDLDHAGGLSDFPEASVHIFEPELRAATERRTAAEKARYPLAQRAHGPKWVPHVVAGDSWLGFDRIQVIGKEDLAIVPLVGHSRGHSAILVRAAEGWLLHAGDAYFFHGEVDPSPAAPETPAGLRVFQRFAAIDDPVRRANQARLKELVREHGSEVRVFSAHDPVELTAFQKP